MNSALIARNYVDARLLLMAEIINSTVNSRDNVMYRRQALKLINETVVYIKESIELVRRWRYVTSKDESIYHEEHCEANCPPISICSSVDPHWHASLPLIEWKKTADWLIDYPDVCTPGKLDCDLIRKELSHTFIISSGCTEFKGLNLNSPVLKQVFSLN